MILWIEANAKKPRPWSTVRVTAIDLIPSWKEQGWPPDGEYDGFYDDENDVWNCYTGAHDMRNLYQCTVTRWHPLKDGEI